MTIWYNTARVRLHCGEGLGHIEWTVEQHICQMVGARGLAALCISTWESLMDLIVLWEDRWCVLRCMWICVCIDAKQGNLIFCDPILLDLFLAWAFLIQSCSSFLLIYFIQDGINRMNWDSIVYSRVARLLDMWAENKLLWIMLSG